MTPVVQQAGEPSEAQLNYAPLFDFATKHGISYNELCAVVRESAALSADALASQPQQPQAETPLTEPGPSAPEPSDRFALLKELGLTLMAHCQEQAVVHAAKARERDVFGDREQEKACASAVEDAYRAMRWKVRDESDRIAKANGWSASAPPVPTSHPNTGAHPPEAEPAAFMYPSDLERFQRSETTATAISVSCTNIDTGERTVALYASPPEARADAGLPAWQPIETAPNYGFLAYRRGRIADAYRVQRDDCEMWVFGGESGAFENFPEVKPSHWMPLPLPPEAQEPKT